MNNTPTSLRPLVAHGTRAVSGAVSLAAKVNLKASDAQTIAEDLYDLDGRAPDVTATPPVPEILGKVHPGRRTPWVAILFTASIAAVLVCLGDLETLADTTVLLLLLVFIGVNASLIVLRNTPSDHEHFRAWTILPYLGALTCAGLAIQSIVDDPKLVLWAGGLIVFGLILWVIEKAVR